MLRNDFPLFNSPGDLIAFHKSRFICLPLNVTHNSSGNVYLPNATFSVQVIYSFYLSAKKKATFSLKPDYLKVIQWLRLFHLLSVTEMHLQLNGLSHKKKLILKSILHFNTLCIAHK